jgi:hypothetical protein
MQQQQISFADVIARVIDFRADTITPPLSPHSTSYFVSKAAAAVSGEDSADDKHAIPPAVASAHTSSLEAPTAFSITAASPQHVSSIAEHGFNLLGSTGINVSLSKLLQPKRSAASRFLDHKFWRMFCSFMIVVQFGMNVLQLEIVFSERQCRRTQAGAPEDAWSGCQSWSYLPNNTLSQIDSGFNASHFIISTILLLDIVADICRQGQLFFFKNVGYVAWLNVIDTLMQSAIFVYDVLQLAVLPPSVTRPDFIAISVLRLLRVYRVLAMVKTVTSAIALLRNLFPIFKAYVLIAYTFFFIFSIFGMSLFSFAASSRGVSFYPTKSQYIQFYTDRDPDSYPNGNNPGNFGCNSTDVLGTPGVCGQAGPQSPLPHWSIIDSSTAAVAALDAAFVVGNGMDARVGGCYNLVGDADNRVLPCYCFYLADRMNRTTSCDWLNPAWYTTDMGQVMARPPRHCDCAQQTRFAERVLDPQLQRL